MGKILPDNPNFEMRNPHFLSFAEDLKKASQERSDLAFVFTRVSIDQLQRLKSVPVDLRILYNLVGEFQINHKSGYVIFDFFLPQEAIENIFLSNWTSEEKSEHALKNKFIFGIEHINHNTQNFFFYDIKTLEIGLLIPNRANNLLDILRIELDQII